MAVISCPNCEGKLQFADGPLPPQATCPFCNFSFTLARREPGTVLPAPPAPRPAPPPPEFSLDLEKADENGFEIVDQSTPVANSPRDLVSLDDEAEGPRKPRRDEDDDARSRRNRRDEDDDRSRPRRRDEDDDERGRPRRRDEERPRSRRADFYDDDDERRPSRQLDDEDDDDRRDSRPTTIQFRHARQGISLIGIGCWCQVGALGVALFTFFLEMIARQDVAELFIPAGLAGLACWILTCIGASFLIAGPKKGSLLGLTIALVAVAGAHLLVLFFLMFQKERFYLAPSGGVHWGIIPTQFLFFMLSLLLDASFFIGGLFAALLELARFILLTLVIKECGRIVKNSEIPRASTVLLFVLPSVVAASMLFLLILKVVYKNTSGGGSEVKYLLMLILILALAGYIYCASVAAMLCGKCKEVLYRSR
jgi:hypothetical protein